MPAAGTEQLWLGFARMQALRRRRTTSSGSPSSRTRRAARIPRVLCCGRSLRGLGESADGKQLDAADPRNDGQELVDVGCAFNHRASRQVTPRHPRRATSNVVHRARRPTRRREAPPPRKGRGPPSRAGRRPRRAAPPSPRDRASRPPRPRPTAIANSVTHPRCSPHERCPALRTANVRRRVLYSPRAAGRHGRRRGRGRYRRCGLDPCRGGGRVRATWRSECRSGPVIARGRYSGQLRRRHGRRHVDGRAWIAAAQADDAERELRRLRPTEWPDRDSLAEGGVAIVAGVAWLWLPRESRLQRSVRRKILEFRASFGGDGFQNVGFGDTFADAPWAMFSAGDPSLPRGPVRAHAQPLGRDTEQHGDLGRRSAPATYLPHRVVGNGGELLRRRPVRRRRHASSGIAGPMRAVVSDLGLGGNLVGVDWLAMQLFQRAAVLSRVHDAGDSRVLWGSLNATVTGSNPVIETRSGPTATPDDGNSYVVRAARREWGRRQSERALHPVPHEPKAGHAQPRQGPDQLDVDKFRADHRHQGRARGGTSATVSFSSPATISPGSDATSTAAPAAHRAVHESEVCRSLASGLHTISVRGVDKFGNVGETVARRFRLRADKTAPKVSVVARSLRASRKGRVSFRVGCPSTRKALQGHPAAQEHGQDRRAQDRDRRGRQDRDGDAAS